MEDDDCLGVPTPAEEDDDAVILMEEPAALSCKKSPPVLFGGGTREYGLLLEGEEMVNVVRGLLLLLLH